MDGALVSLNISDPSDQAVAAPPPPPVEEASSMVAPQLLGSRGLLAFPPGARLNTSASLSFSNDGNFHVVSSRDCLFSEDVASLRL